MRPSSPTRWRGASWPTGVASGSHRLASLTVLAPRHYSPRPLLGPHRSGAPRSLSPCLTDRPRPDRRSWRRPGPYRGHSYPIPKGGSSVPKTATSSPVMPENTQDRLLALHDVAAQLSCSPALVRRLGARGVLPRVKIGRLTRYRASDEARL